MQETAAINAIPQPQSGDLVLGGGSPKATGLVLGGITGARRRLLSGDESVRLATVAGLVGYGEAGIQLLIEALSSNTAWAVRLAAWRVLSELADPQAQAATQQLSPFRDVGGAQGLIVAYRRGERDFSYGELAGVDLSGYRLGGINFFQANLKNSQVRRVNLNGANLVKSDWRAADLTGSKLSGANLEGADLRGCRLGQVKVSGTNLRLSQISDPSLWDEKVVLIWQLQNQGGEQRQLSQVDLSKADLRQISLQGCSLREGSLMGVDLRGSNLSRADLRGADLRGADLRGATLQEADLSGANLSRANLQHADLRGADLSRADLTKANLQRANLTSAKLEGLKHRDTWTEGMIFADGSGTKPWWW
ncbi:MAG: pentapeptide repeat-containing protein [Cyanobacteriota bacterium]|nr:pentapeptide repeat-containing protein [Cyanobacteriota bacterium]